MRNAALIVLAVSLHGLTGCTAAAQAHWFATPGDIEMMTTEQLIRIWQYGARLDTPRREIMEELHDRGELTDAQMITWQEHPKLAIVDARPKSAREVLRPSAVSLYGSSSSCTTDRWRTTIYRDGGSETIYGATRTCEPARYGFGGHSSCPDR